MLRSLFSSVTRVIAVVALTSLLGLHIQSVGAVEPAALGVTTDFDFVDCTSIEGSFSWTDLPDDGWVFVEAQDTIAVQQNFYYLVDSFHNEGGVADDGTVGFALPFESSSYEWTLILQVYDTAWNPLLEVTETFLRPCVTGSVSAGGTGDGSVEAIDSRSGDDGEFVEPAESGADPDDDGRVQVP